MINLLPPTVKEQKKYAIYNVVIARYTFLLVGSALLIIGVLLGSQLLATIQLGELNQELKIRQKQLSTKDKVLAEGQAINNQIKISKDLLKNEYKYSSLLDDLAEALPAGSRFVSLILDGDETKPLRIGAEVLKRNQVDELQQALLQSPRFTYVDVQSINDGETGVRVELIARFAPGASR